MGSPERKVQAIASVLERMRCRRVDALVIGDSCADFEVAQSTGIDFNSELQQT